MKASIPSLCGSFTLILVLSGFFMSVSCGNLRPMKNVCICDYFAADCRALSWCVQFKTADERPCGTKFNKILKVERPTNSGPDIPALLEKLRPICVFDASRPECYRDSVRLRGILEAL